MVFWRTSHLRSAALVAACLAVFSLQPAFGQQLSTSALGSSGETPILLRADDITQDQELGIVVARGSVEVANGERVLLSDTLSYNQNAKTVTASGNVRLLEPDGTVLFSEFMELSEDLLEGTIENIRVLLQDDARLAANGARRTGGNRTELAKGVYSPCEACKDDPQRAPLWQVKAQRVVHDQEGQQVTYTNAFLEMFGIPVMYTPYLSHPDPTVERRSGFLAPSYGTSTTSGTFVRVPYFWAIDDSQDLTFDPVYTIDDGLFGSGEYRRAFDDGEITISGSLGVADLQTTENGSTVTKEDELRGHVFVDASYDIDETWRAGLNMQRLTDKAYLRRFGYWTNPGNFATSEAFIEGFRGRHYAIAQALSFQELRSSVTADTPEIFPIMNYRGLGDADGTGGRWSLDAASRVLTDNDDADSRMISLHGGYRSEQITSFGLVNIFDMKLRGDLYHLDQLASASATGVAERDGFTGRLIPSIGYTASYPLARYSIQGRQVIEPVFAAFLAPNGGNPSEIANADSLGFEADYISLFDPNRVNGLDRIETGQRVVGGVKLTHFQDDGGRLQAFVGNSYRFREDASLRDDLNIRAGQSDFVGMLQASPNSFFDFGYRFNFSANDGRANRSEVYGTLGGSGLKLNGQYSFLRDTVSTDTPEVEELSLSGSSQLDEFWSVRASTLQDLTDGGDSLMHSVAMRYEDECFVFDGTFQRTFFTGEDVTPEDLLLFKLTFKTLGEVQF